MCGNLRAGSVQLKPVGQPLVGFFQRERAAAQLLMQAAVQLFVSVQPRGLVGYVPSRIGRRDFFQFVHGSEEPFHGLALAVVGPGVDDFTAKVTVQAEESGLLKVLAAVEEPRPECLAVVQIDNAGEFPQPDAGPAERAGNTGYVFRSHHFPAQRVTASSIEEQKQRHALGLVRARNDGFKIQCMTVRDNYVAHAYQRPVPQDGYGTPVVPGFFAVAPQCPVAETRLGVVGYPAPDGIVRGNGQIFRLAPLLYDAGAGADLAVAVQDLPQNDGMMPFREHALAPVGKAALIGQSQDAAGVLLFQLPAFQTLPAYARAEFRKELAPRAALIGKNEGLFLPDGAAVFCLPVQVKPQKVGLRQRLVAALIVKDGFSGQCGNMRTGSHGEDCIVGCLFLYRPAFLRRLDGALRRFRHGGNKPFLPAAASLAWTGLPAAGLGLSIYPLSGKSQQWSECLRCICFLKCHCLFPCRCRIPAPLIE